MKKILFVVVLLTISANLNAQNPDSIIGKWVFTKALNEDIDQDGLEILNSQVLGKWKFEFKADGKYDTFMMGEKTSGNWILKPNTIVLTGMEGGPQELIILNSTKNELALKLGLGKFLLTRIKE